MTRVRNAYAFTTNPYVTDGIVVVPAEQEEKSMAKTIRLVTPLDIKEHLEGKREIFVEVFPELDGPVDWVESNPRRPRKPRWFSRARVWYEADWH